MTARPLSALSKLNQMHELFVGRDDDRLGRGEVDALAAYYEGLPSRSRASVKPRLIEIYRDSTYQNGQKGWFLNRLEKAGLKTGELEGVSENSATAFLRMSHEAQLNRIQELHGDYGDGFTKDIQESDIAPGARAKVKTGIHAFKADFTRKAGGEPPEFGDESYQAIYLEEGANGRGKELCGFAVDVGIYHDDHDVNEMLFFNTKGELLGHVYNGE